MGKKEALHPLVTCSGAQLVHANAVHDIITGFWCHPEAPGYKLTDSWDHRVVGTLSSRRRCQTSVCSRRSNKSHVTEEDLALEEFKTKNGKMCKSCRWSGKNCNRMSLSDDNWWLWLHLKAARRPENGFIRHFPSQFYLSANCFDHKSFTKCHIWRVYEGGRCLMGTAVPRLPSVVLPQSSRNMVLHFNALSQFVSHLWEHLPAYIC